MPKHAALVRTAKFLITVVSLLIQANLTASSEPSELFKELPLNSQIIHQLPSSSAESFQLSSEDANSLTRLADLLRLKLSMLDVLSQNLGIDNQDSDTRDHLDKSRLAKRVFCNGFTGCGGRFRGRRRQQPPVAEIGKRLLPNFRKRPFCNSYGCYNSGKKRFSPVSVKNDRPPMAALTDDWSHDKIKRLFCNSYGGCQNVGKRWVAMDADVDRADGAELRIPLLISKGMLEKLGSTNQVLSSDLEEAGSSIDNARR